jgi:cold shock CspA family protein
MDVDLNGKTLNVVEEEVTESQPKLISSDKSSSSPKSGGNLQLPSPIITRRNRRPSAHERALVNPVEKGKVSYFCRTKGHGFITSDHSGEEIFVHISDIEGEYIPKEGDAVSYRLCPIPPKLEKFQAIHVKIIHFAEDIHVKWNAPVGESEKLEN